MGGIPSLCQRWIAWFLVAAFSAGMTAHASLLARLDRLAPTREVAQIGAALRRQFSHGLISGFPNRAEDAILAHTPIRPAFAGSV